MKRGLVLGVGLIVLSLILLTMMPFPFASWTAGSKEESKRESWQKLNGLAEQALDLAQRNQWEASKKRLGQLTSHFLALKTGDYVERLEQVQVLTQTIVQAEEALNRVTPDPEEIIQRLLRLRLVLDAVSHHRQPLWLNYYPNIIKTMDELIEALQEDKRDLFYQRINQLASQYEFIRPAIVVSHDAETVAKMDSKIKFLMDKRSELWHDEKRRLAFLEGLEKDWKYIFYQNHQEQSISFIYLMIGMGTLICSVLTYVAWRKYRGEKETKKVVWKK